MALDNKSIQIWPRPTQKSFQSVGLSAGHDLAAEIANWENSRWVWISNLCRMSFSWPISSKFQCDEGKPQCKRCSLFGILCNFKPNIPDLQPVADDSVRALVVRERSELQPPLTGTVWTSDFSTSYQLNAKSQDFVTRYLGRSLITPNDPNMIEVNRKLLILTFTVSIIKLFLSLSIDHILCWLLRAWHLLTYDS